MKKLLFLLISLFEALLAVGQGAPNEQDCLGAIPVCQPVYYTATSYTGHGNVYPEIHTGSACPNCMDGEKNDVFYTFTVQTQGIFRFTITPVNPNNDYDWILFNMTNANCDDLYPNAAQLQVSCNSYGVQGYNGPTGINTSQSNNKSCNGPGTINGPAFNKDLLVEAGQTYLLNISNWSPTNQEGYTLDFSASTAQIFDNVAPYIDSIQNSILCSGSSTLFVRFSENMKCIDLQDHPEKFTITSTNGTYTVTGVTSTDCTIGATQTFTCTLNVSPPLFGGDYNLNIVGDLGDLCGNLALYQEYPFHLTELNAPSANAGNDTTVPNGAIINLHGSGSGGSGIFTWHWEPANLLLDPNVQVPTTLNLGASTTFTLTVTDTNGCHADDDVVITVTGGQLGVTVTADPGTICAGEPAQLNAMPTGGTGNYNYAWTSNPPGFTSNIPDPVVYPVVNTSYHVQLFDGYTTVNGSTEVLVNPLPLANAGSDFSIPYGTYTTLHGTGSGGSGNYSYYWTSNFPGFSSSNQNPVTPNLNVTTIFYLVVTDINTGCASLPSQITITVTGSAISANPFAAMPVICLGSSTQLFALAGGGAGVYTYSWTSDPAGFSSTQQNPFVAPLITTTYTVVVDDGFNQATGSVTVSVDPVPLIHLGPADTSVCVFDSLALDAGNPGSTFYWSNGSTQQKIFVTTSGLAYDYQTYTVHVTNSFGCTDSATIHVVFSFAACTGINDFASGFEWKVYPNPATSEINVEIPSPDKNFMIQLIDKLGRVVLQKAFQAIPGSVYHGTIPVDDLSRGLYFIRIQDSSGSGIKKVVIN